MRHRPLVAVVGWLAASVAATVTGLAAVQVIGDGITATSADEVLTPGQVERQLASATASPSVDPNAPPSVDTPTPAPPGASSSKAPAQPVRKVLPTPGGTVVAECAAGIVTLVSMSPAQGFGVKRADRGPSHEHADVVFEADTGKVELRVRCSHGEPTASWKQDD